MKKGLWRASTAAIAVALGRPALADPLAAATMVVFDSAGPRQVDLTPADAPTLTVFTPDGARALAMTPSWPRLHGGGSLAVSAGPRYDRAAFTIGGRGYPNVLSELQWKVPAAEIRVDGRWTHLSGFAIKGHVAYAAAVSGGEVRDSDYALNDRQAEFSRSYANPDESRMLDAALGAGWQLPLGQAATLTPMLGLARYAAEYRQRAGRLTVSNSANADLLGIDWSAPLGRFDGLHSSYKPVWYSNWLGIDGEFRPAGPLALRASLRQHWFRYKATANWNLRGDLAHPISFLHQGYGQGLEAELGADWRLLRGHRLSLDLGWRDFRVGNGSDTTFFADGSSSAITLGSATADSWSARLGYRYDY